MESMNEKSSNDVKRLIEMLEKIRSTFPDWGFVVGVCEMDNNSIWGWSNMKDPSPVFKFLAEQEAITVRSLSRN